MKKKIPFKIGSKTAKYLKINLTKEVHELYNKSYMTLMKETEKGKWREVAQSCPTLCDLMDCSPPGSSVHWIFQAWILEWVAISFSRGSSRPRDRTLVSRIVGRCFTIQATREAGRKKKKEGGDTNKQKYITYSWIGRVNTALKCPYYPEPPINLMQSLIKFQWHFSQK